MAAARLADVGAADPQPLVLGRRREHPLEQLAVAGLQLGPFAQLDPRLGDPVGERVADRLQLAEAEHPRLGREGRRPGVEADAGKGVGEERAELGFQAADLPPQLGAGKPLVAADAQRGSSISVEQIRHTRRRV